MVRCVFASWKFMISVDVRQSRHRESLRKLIKLPGDTMRNWL